MRRTERTSQVTHQAEMMNAGQAVGEKLERKREQHLNSLKSESDIDDSDSDDESGKFEFVLPREMRQSKKSEEEIEIKAKIERIERQLKESPLDKAQRITKVTAQGTAVAIKSL
ncbi:MAG: hypothetical protein WCK49_09455, partial [Myxococcaceae bacterium]